MKIKHTALLLAFVLACGTITTSCSSSDNTVQEDTLTSREVDFSKTRISGYLKKQPEKTFPYKLPFKYCTKCLLISALINTHLVQ